MSYSPKLIASQSEYIKALIWFRGGSTQDNTDYFNINKNLFNRNETIKCIFRALQSVHKRSQTMKRKFRKFWREWGMTRDEMLWFLLIPTLSLYIFILVIIVLVLI